MDRKPQLTNNHHYQHIYSTNHHLLSPHCPKMPKSQQQHHLVHLTLLIHLVVFVIILMLNVKPSQTLAPTPMLSDAGIVYGGIGGGSLAFADSEDPVGSLKPVDPNSVANDLADSKPLATIHVHKLHKAHKTSGSGSGHKFLGDSNKIIKEGALYLNAHQRDLIKRHPGSLLAVARAFKMAVVECQYQMRHEPWDCPTYGFSIRPIDIFGKLMSRNFKETSFVHSLLSSAIAHSIARACTESMIITCGRKRTRDGGYSEDIDFGRQFAQEFMEATHESLVSTSAALSTNSHNNIDRNLNNNIIQPGGGTGSGGSFSEPVSLHQYSSATLDPLEREKRIRAIINAHNDEVGRLHILNGMRRECKCHGVSGACNIQTCWLKLPPFREVATKLHDSLDQAIKVIYLDPNQTNRQKSLTSNSVKKSNKKRSSAQQVNGLSRSSSPPYYDDHHSNPNSYKSSYSLISDTANMIVSRPRGGKYTNKDDCEDSLRAPVGGCGAAAVKRANAQDGLGESQHGRGDQSILPTTSNNSSMIKRRPVARSIGIVISRYSPSKFDLLYREDSPDFCIPSENYNIKGTKGRICSENPNASNSCARLCCKRGYVTEVREEQYKCECQFKFCCSLNCNTCTRKKTTHICV